MVLASSPLITAAFPPVRTFWLGCPLASSILNAASRPPPAPRSIRFNALTAAVVEAVVMAVKMNRFKLEKV